LRSKSRSLGAVIAALVAVAGCGRGGGGGAPAGGSRAGAGPGGSAGGGRPPVPVVVAEAARKDVPRELTAVGNVQAFVTVSVRPLVGGAIVGVFFKEGDEVQQGQRLFQIDPRPYQATLAQARGALEQARQQASNAKADAARYARLVKSSFVTQQQYDSAVANARALAGQVAADEAAVRRAQLDLQNCRIEAPIGGRTGAVLVQIGNVVQANQANPLVVIAQLKPISVAFTVPSANVSALREGAGRMTVVADAQAGRREGRLEFVNNTVDPSAGTILAKATFPNEDEALWPGEYVNVRVVLGTLSGAVVAPAAAIVSGQSGPFVYVVKPDGTVEQRPVKVAQADAREAVIAGGLSAGETVVTDGQLALVPGARVAVKQRVGGNDAPRTAQGQPGQADGRPANEGERTAADPAAAPAPQQRQPADARPDPPARVQGRRP
jgi:multidrug efflux system membrane fusion protein